MVHRKSYSSNLIKNKALDKNPEQRQFCASIIGFGGSDVKAGV
jgi:hypothetical protein